MTTELRDLLELASEDVVEVDLAHPAWEQARREERLTRRRVLLGAGGLAAAGAVAVLVARPRDEAAVPARTPTPSPSLDGRLDEQTVGAVRVSMAPSRALEEQLPAYPEAMALALPGLLGDGVDRPGGLLGPEGVRGTQASVRAVFLVNSGLGYRPVVFVPRADPQLLLAPHAVLAPVYDNAGAQGPVLGPRTIDDDRHRIVIAQRRRIVVLDVRDASVLELPVPDEGLLHAGWAKDGRTVIARSAEQDWLVDTQTHQVRRPEVPSRPDWEDLVLDTAGRTSLRSFAGSGTLTATRPLPGTRVTPYGESAANTEAWVASGVLLDRALARETGRTQGVLAVQDDLSLSPRVLAGPVDAREAQRAYRPLGWGPRDTLLLESRASSPPHDPAARILAWDVIGARLWRVGDVVAPEPQDGGFTGRYAI